MRRERLWRGDDRGWKCLDHAGPIITAVYQGGLSEEHDELHVNSLLLEVVPAIVHGSTENRDQPSKRVI